MNKPDELLAAARPLMNKHSKDVEGLIVLSLMYHAFRQKGDKEGANKARQLMKELFDTLKDKPDAFPAKTGEYSREYWEKVWFGEK